MVSNIQSAEGGDKGNSTESPLKCLQLLVELRLHSLEQQTEKLSGFVIKDILESASS